MIDIPIPILTTLIVILAGVGGYLIKSLIVRVNDLDDRLTKAEKTMAVDYANTVAAIDKLTVSINHAVESIDARVYSYTQTVDKMIETIADQRQRERSERTVMIESIDSKVDRLLSRE